MPRKTQFTADDVVMAAVNLVRDKGWAAVSAPAVADKMGCSTMPIYSHFKNMRALKDEVVKKTWKMVLKFQARRYTGDVWVDHAIGWVTYAREEPNLFTCMLDSSNVELQKKMDEKHWNQLAEWLEGYEGFRDLNEEQTERVRYAQGKLTHGVATTPRRGFNKVVIENDEALFSVLATASQALLEGYKNVPPLMENQKRFIEEKLKELESESREKNG